MEALFLLLVVAVFFVLSLSRKTSGKSRYRPNPSYRRDLQPEARPAPFDAQKAIPVVGMTVLQGFAYVIDGDTLVINKTQIRLCGVDAPELDHPYGKKAKWALVLLCKGHSVRAEVIERDTHGRTVAECFLPDGRDLSAEMVKLGMALDWPKYSGGKYRALETPEARRRLWLADARQKGRMEIWDNFEAKQRMQSDKA